VSAVSTAHRAAPVLRQSLSHSHSSNALRLATPAQSLVISMAHLDGVAVSSALGGDVTRHELARMRNQGSLLGIRCGRHGYLYPSFQIDEVAGRVLPVVSSVNRLLHRHLSVEQTIRWWLDRAGTVDLPRLELLDAVSELTAEAKDVLRRRPA